MKLEVAHGGGDRDVDLTRKKRTWGSLKPIKYTWYSACKHNKKKRLKTLKNNLKYKILRTINKIQEKNPGKFVLC